MNQHLQNIWSLVQQNADLSDEQKNALFDSLKNVNKEMEIISFKLDRTEKVKRTTAILLEETIEELEQKRKAVEIQNRELEVETSLERVRAKAMAMQKSEQLSETAKILFEQFKLLGNIPDRVTIGIINDDNKEIELWTTDQVGSQLDQKYYGSIEEATSIAKIYKAWKEGKDSIVIDLSGQDLKDWIRYLREDMKLSIDDENIKGRRVQQAAFFSHGILLFTSNEPVADEIMQLLVRFAKAFDQAYTRFLDLKKAEEQVREAIKQASLDRVRGQIASMRSTEDLDRITPLIWHELKTLDVPFIRCGIFIVHEDQQNVQVYLTAPDGKPLASLNLPIDANALTKNAVAGWHSKKVYTEHWNKADFINWMDSMIELGQIQTQEKYQGNSKPPESLHLHFIPFAQGMLYVGDLNMLSNDNIEMVKSLAEAFSIAYARYEDFINLEEAKERVEKSLTDLRAAQSQLVQQEKLASLGQLTAGIAHEIKNPLNFVNNFSELSIELIDEIFEELENTGEIKSSELIIENLTDIKANVQKVHEHGTRADSIVKSMLMHSRGGSGNKVPVDLNKLVTENVNLTFHSMRASKNPINVKIEYDLDDSIGEVWVITEDFSRVIVNLCSNAFDAMREKNKQTGDYHPLLTITSKRQNDQVIIEVQDNGPGISNEILDKILLPFFTTKKGTEGTGLGLSITNDILKAHGGGLSVETKKGTGVTFKIQFPV